MSKSILNRTSRKFDGPALRLAAAAALVAASACAAPLLATEIRGARDAGPVRCGIATETRAGTTAFRPWVELADNLPGSYRFTLQGEGARVDQAGGFDAVERTVTLGEAVLSGPARAYDARLTVTVDGTSYSCRAGTDET